MGADLLLGCAQTIVKTVWGAKEANHKVEMAADGPPPPPRQPQSGLWLRQSKGEGSQEAVENCLLLNPGAPL